MTRQHAVIAKAAYGIRPNRQEALELAEFNDLTMLMKAAETITLEGFGRNISYSRKVFIPLTQLCRDVCHYCTFAQTPKKLGNPFLLPKAILEIAKAGAVMGCKEALFTLGDKPELRYRVAQEALDDLGYKDTLSYLEAMARLVLNETGLLPHLNPGIMTREELGTLRPVSSSMGIMLESSSERLCSKGNVHWGSPDKAPHVHLQTIRDAGALKIPFTSGILIGIGETRLERIETLLALRDIHDEFDHIQEIIVQNFRVKPGTKMANAPEPDLADQQWTIAIARILFGSRMAIQTPPNLRPDGCIELVGAGINDWGGVSPLTPDHVNPEAAWPQLDVLEKQTRKSGRMLTERLSVYPRYILGDDDWLDTNIRKIALRHVDAQGFIRQDQWFAGMQMPLPFHIDATSGRQVTSPEIQQILENAESGIAPDHEQIATLFGTHDTDLTAVLATADRMRANSVGDTVRYVVNRNINYTNVCKYRCTFCAFSKGKTARDLRGPAYDLAEEEIDRRVREAWHRGVTEVCLQGGIHPRYTGETYLNILRIVKTAAPQIHIHAFSPLEVTHGAETMGLPLRDFLTLLKDAGLSTLPGTAAEILDDEVRKLICPDKVSTAQWLKVMETAHQVGLRSTATIMFGHVDEPRHWANHLVHIRTLQQQTDGFTEFVPLPFVHMESPIWLKGYARSGPTYREALLMHAVARIALNPCIKNIQTSWVKMGPQGAKACLQAGANDLGGVLMNESITRAAGAGHGQEMRPVDLEELIGTIGRYPAQRTTLYDNVDARREKIAFTADAIEPVVNTPLNAKNR